MNENSDLLPNLLHEEFEMQMRGYSRRQVDDFVARRNNEIRELEQRLARSLDESEHLRREIATTRQQALTSRPAHEEVSERIAQILKLADDEAKAQKGKADDDIARQRAEAQQESERVRADAREQAERMLTAAQEQAERTISAARNEADKTRTAARTEADRLTSDTRKKADAALANAKSQAKKVLDEATARATAIHDGAERRLNLLSTRHSETVRRLTDILEAVQGLVAAESSRLPLEDEVSQTVSSAIAALEPPRRTETAPGPSGSSAPLAPPAPPAPEALTSGTTAPVSGTAIPVSEKTAPIFETGTPVSETTVPVTETTVPVSETPPPASTTDNGSQPSAHTSTGPQQQAPGTSRPVTVHPVSVLGDPLAGFGNPASWSASQPETDSSEPPATQGPGSGLHAPLPAGRHATPPPAPPAPLRPVMPRRLSAPPAESPRNSLPAPSGLPSPGPAATDPPSGFPAREPRQGEGHSGGSRTNPPGFIDPDTPSEGFRIIR